MVKGAKTIAQYIILRWIDQNFINAKTRLIAPDVVKMIDDSGKSMLLSINIHEQILNYETRQILSEKE